MISDHSLEYVMLLETKSKVNCLTLLAKEIGMEHYQDFNPGNSHIWILWRHNVHVNVVDVHSQCVSFELSTSKSAVLITTVYAFNKKTKRRALWEHVSKLAETVDKPCCVGGDFNVIRFPLEKLASSDPDFGALREFNNFINDTEL